MRMPLDFDKRDLYESGAKVLVDELKKICTDAGMPFFICVCTSNMKNSDGEYVPTYVREGRTPASFNGTIPNDDEISKHYSVACGARVINQSNANYSKFSVGNTKIIFDNAEDEPMD